LFYLSFIVLTATGIGVSIAVFIWAIKSGQFSDQGRARYLPLSVENPVPPADKPSKPLAEVYAMVFILVMGFVAIGSAVILTLMRI
jgi:cbb3-type cytochrome oxidase maturation protein